MHPALMVVDAECLTGRSADKAVQFALFQTGGFQEIGRRHGLDRTGHKRRLCMCRRECFARELIYVISG